MKNKLYLYLIVLFSVIVSSCEKDEEIDTTKPAIDFSISGAFPTSCSDTVYFGEPFAFRLKFTDNVELGSYSIDIHHNFDHHSHSTEAVECNLDPKKDPVNAYTGIADFTIPDGRTEYITDDPLSIPLSNTIGQFDEGDYHFLIRVTDKEGWSTSYGIGIRMAYR
ncbi:MAG TPA: hypothetical protein DDX92_10085 [Flavobacteriales bacterium]|nr:hypothetical protein [Flavobacteriales bacterium]